MPFDAALRALVDPQHEFGSALTHWWDARDHGTSRMVDDGAGLISSWTDRIAGLALTGTTTQRPTWSATALGSAYDGLTLNGSTNRLRAAATTGLPSGTTRSIVGALCAPAALATMITFGHGDAIGYRRCGFTNQSGSIRQHLATASGVTLNGTQQFTSGQPVWLWWYFDSICRQRRFGDMGASTLSTTLATGTGTTCIGANTAASPGNFFNGVISQVLVLAW